MKHVLAWTAIALAAGCSRAEVIEGPPLRGEGSILVVIAAKGEARPIVQAMDLAQPAPIELEASEAELVIVEYCCPLETLGLEAGLQTLLELPREAKALPDAKHMYFAQLTGGVPSAWSEDGDPALALAAIARLDLPTDHLCSLYDREIRVVDVSVRGVRTSSAPAFLIGIGEGRVFGATRSGLFFTASASGSALETQLSTSTPHHGAHRTEDGEIWLVGDDGRTMRGDLLRGFEPVDARAQDGVPSFVQLSGARGSAPFELFAVNDRRSFQRFHGDRWNTIVGPQLYDPSRVPPSVAWIGPDEAIAAGIHEDPARLLHYKRGDLVEERSVGNPGIAVHLPGHGTVLGSRGGAIRFLDGFTWSEPRTIGGIDIHAIAEMGESLIVCGHSHLNPLTLLCSTYHPRSGACAIDEAFGGDSMRGMINIDARRAITFAPDASRPETSIRLSLLEATRDLPACLEAP